MTWNYPQNFEKHSHCGGGFCSTPHKLIVLFGELSPQGFVFRPRVWKSRIFTSSQGLCLVAILAWHLCPTSIGDAPHSWFISPWSDHECTPQKRLFVGYFTPQAYCPLWGVKPARFCFSASSMGVQDFHLRPRALPCSHFGLTPL